MLALADFNQRTNHDLANLSLNQESQKRRKIADGGSTYGVVAYSNFSTMSFENRRLN